MQSPGTQWHAGEASRQAGEEDLVLGYALLRITLGINIAMHGISRILAGPGTFAASLTQQFSSTVLPHFALLGFGYALPWLETLIGLLVLVGALTRVALVAGASLIAVLTFGSSLHQDWNIVGLQLIYAIVYFMLIGWLRYNWLSIDGWLFRGDQAHLRE